MPIKRSLSLFFLFFSFLSLSQTENDLKLAQHYYQNGDFEKAITYYEKIYNSDQSKTVYNSYLDCLIATKDFNTAEKTIKKQISLNKKDLEIQLQLGFFYEKIKEDNKAKKTFNEVIALTAQNPTSVIEVFKAFIKQNKSDLAKEVLDRGSKQMPDYPFQLVYADYYHSIGNKSKVIDTYLDLLDRYPEYQEAIQYGLEEKFDFSEDGPDLQDIKSAFLEKIQKPNSRFEFSEMLIWLFLQNKNFSAAFVQVVALDKRLRNMGARVMELGKMAIENESFDEARKCFNYVVELGLDAPYYFEAEMAILNTRYVELSLFKIYTNEELETTLNEYKKVIDRMANSRKSFNVVLEYTKIMAQYAGKKAAAISILEQFITTPGLSDMQRATVKMLLADFYVLNARIWDASILYMQIDNDYKFDIIGNEAKYKNARVFYFDGEFDFAQSQLSVLKESTSKLIANDAMQLSVAITDNFGLDSNYQAMMWYASADLLLEQNQVDSAFYLFDSIQLNYPFHSLNDEILYKKGQAMERQKKWAEASVFYEMVVSKYPTDILGDDAIYRLAKINENYIKDKEKALFYYKELLFNYSNSLYSDESRNKIRELRGDKVIIDDL
jgi:tetratricopeptide (TPR) repeat protein